MLDPHRDELLDEEETEHVGSCGILIARLVILVVIPLFFIGFFVFTSQRPDTRPEKKPRVSVPPSPDDPSTVTRFIELSEAVAQGLVNTTVTGRGLDKVRVTLLPLSAQPLHLSITPGTVFKPHVKTTQKLISRRLSTRLLSPSAAAEWTIEVAGMDMRLAAPRRTDQFTITRVTPPAALSQLLGTPGFNRLPFRIQQGAIWILTDNPPREELDARCKALGLGSAPTGSEYKVIADLLIRAGFTTRDYRAYAR